MVPVTRGNHQDRLAFLVLGYVLVGEEDRGRNAFGLSAAHELCLYVL